MTGFLEELHRAAVVLSAEEERLRRRNRVRLEALAPRRQRAHRRWHLLQVAVQAAAGGIDAVLSALAAELELADDAALLAAARPLAEAVVAAVNGDGAADPVAALDALEAWHRGRHGGELLAPRQAASDFQPLVDF